MLYDIVAVGGGIVGLASVYALLEKKPGMKVLLLEKEPIVGQHQTTHNSGVLHCGLYYKPGSAKAQLSVSGIRMMTEFCERHNIPHEICGKLVVAADESELPGLDRLWERGNANGLQGLRRLDTDAIHEIEPHVRGVAAIHVPQEGIVDYAAVVEALVAEIQSKGGEVKTNTAFRKLTKDGDKWRVETSAGDFSSRYVLSCAGLHSDRVAKACGQKPEARIIPFRGEYFKIKAERQELVRNLIYPVPDAKFPFLGVHFTRLIHGGVEAGPNAVLAFAREGYRWRNFKPAELGQTLSYPGLWKFMRRYPSLCFYEVYRSLNKHEFVRSLQRLVPDITVNDLVEGGAGVRAQAMTPGGQLVDDFLFKEDQLMLHVLNAPSPAATASLAIGERIADKVLAGLG